MALLHCQPDTGPLLQVPVLQLAANFDLQAPQQQHVQQQLTIAEPLQPSVLQALIYNDNSGLRQLNPCGCLQAYLPRCHI